MNNATKISTLQSFRTAIRTETSQSRTKLETIQNIDPEWEKVQVLWREYMDAATAVPRSAYSISDFAAQAALSDLANTAWAKWTAASELYNIS